MQHQIVQKGRLRQNDLISGIFEAVSVSCLIAKLNQLVTETGAVSVTQLSIDKLGQLVRETAAQNESGLF